ncbi:MAG: DUF5060 domain-containing protein [Bacteroidota bacterium]
MNCTFKSSIFVFMLAITSVAGWAQTVKSLQIAQYDIWEFEVVAHSVSAHPFTESGITGRFTSPTGKIIIINGFYDGTDNWKLRFTPTELGLWRYQLTGVNFNYNQNGSLACVKGKSNGFISLHPQNKYAFAYQGGKPFFPMGDTSYGLFDDAFITDDIRNAYLDTRRQQGFNFVRLVIGHSMMRARKDNDYWAWGGSAEKPDLDAYNPAFFNKFDAMIAGMKAKRMNAELILLNFYRLPFTTKEWTPKREENWLRYLTARYAAYNNVFLWTIANEYETHPDGVYKLDSNDVKWAANTARYIKANDPYQHLLTVHSVISSTTKGQRTDAPFDGPWQIGGFFGNEKAIDVLSQQTGQSGQGTTWDEQRQYWTGDAVNLTASIAADRRYNKPVVNTESGYEYLTGQPTMRQQVHSTNKVRHSSWRIVCAGGYFAAGFSGTLAHNDIWNELDKPNRYSFLLKDEGAALQLKYLYSFFTALPFWTTQPYLQIEGDAVALKYTTGYIVYLPHGGDAQLLTVKAKDYTVTWYNTRTGAFRLKEKTKKAININLRAPDNEDWVALIN